MGSPLRLLIVEDSDDDAALVVRELRRGGYDVECERVDEKTALSAALATTHWDLVVSDFLIQLWVLESHDDVGEHPLETFPVRLAGLPHPF